MSYKATNPIMRVGSYDPASPKLPSMGTICKYHYIGMRASTCDFTGDMTQSVVLGFSRVSCGSQVKNGGDQASVLSTGRKL
jgi:hypothetical protein